MSLVAYGSSDEESDTSDSEEVQNSDVSKEIRTNDHQEDSEKLTFARGRTETIKERDLVLPSPKQTSEISNSTGRKASLSSFLPKLRNVNNLEREVTRGQSLSPDSKPLVSLTTMADDDDDEIIEIEEEYEPIAKRTKKIASSEGDNKPKSVGSLFSLLPTPWQAENTWQKGADLKKKTNSEQTASVVRGSKQPIKIAIPTAPKNDSDEEDDTCMPAAKKFTPSKEGSGLKSLLPKPKHSITLKVDNPNKPSVKLASRPLIPHTLTKKATTTEKKPQKTTKKKQAEDAISDDEDEPVSFFTFTDKTESFTNKNVETFSSHDTKPNTGIKLYEPSAEITNPSLPSLLQEKMSSTAAGSQSSEKHLTAEIATPPVMDEPSTQTDFGSEKRLGTGESTTRTYYYEQQSGHTQQYGDYSANDYENYSYEPSSSLVNQPYCSQESETYTYTYPTGTVTQEQNLPQETDIDLEKLQKLKGRRNRHEEINIVDVNADDQIGNSADMVAKYGTEEIAHRPSRKKKDMPTAQQRRKHQISYLAFQAKEREFELRQQWSANRQTRRQTQSKYGF